MRSWADGYRRTFDFRGRTSRREFWWFWSINMLINVGIVAFILFWDGLFFILIQYIWDFLVAVLTTSWIIVFIDFFRTGEWAALDSFAPIFTDYSLSFPVFLGLCAFLLFNVIILFPTFTASIRRLHDSGKKGWPVIVSAIPWIGFLFLVFFMMARGTEGKNKYGEAKAEPNAQEKA